MTALLSVYAPRSRRVRLVFSEDVDPSARDATLYGVSSDDTSYASPSVLAVYAVAGQSAAVELVLDSELVSDVSYTVTATGILFVSTATLTVTSKLRYAAAHVTTNSETLVSEGDIILFKRDLLWNGKDFEQTSDGDAATVAGLPNAVAALRERLLGDPLPYNPQYGPDAREFVDSNDATPLGARLRQQALRDPRVTSVEIVATPGDDGTSTVFTVSPKFVGNRVPDPISLSVDT